MTQFLIEEAIGLHYQAVLNREQDEATAADGDDAASAAVGGYHPGPKPGEITDPVMAAAMAEAKRMHKEQFGVNVR